jgi:hypothetical protein
MKEPLLKEEASTKGYSRRNFLGLAGGFIGAGILLSACQDNIPNPYDPNSPTNPADTRINLGSGDVGILNYAYALEQLEAAFYTQVALSPYSNISSAELALLTDIRDHEVAHREFFKAALGSAAIPALEVNFSSINFGDRNSVLQTAKAFEDLGVSAYNGAGKLIEKPDYLLLAGKIVSVEARHAAYIRDLLSNGTFADGTVVDANGLDLSRNPKDVLAIAASYLKSTINADNLPTT